MGYRYQGCSRYPHPANLLSCPDTRKQTSMTYNNDFSVATSKMQGWRPSMEDVAMILLDIPGDNSETSYFGVFDGHGGSKVSQFVGRNLHRFIMHQPEWQTNLKEAIYRGFLDCDEAMRREEGLVRDMSGTTAVTIFIRDNVLYCGNVGDSRAIAYESNRVVPLSFDHKPTVPTEFRRIVSAGGFVEGDRVNGSLALSRALGDFDYKNPELNPVHQIVSPVPEIVIKKIDRAWEFIVLACDGIWEVMSSHMVAEFVRARIRDRMPLNFICEALLTRCLSPRCDGLGLGCDNMTVIIIKFLWSRY
ncbi:probable protein phosphatase 2C T23F11.1 [Cimex lectularius]|uniref:protein-serine/threonine phosphatase n=1 Tax=Cimex lectularius TaxID=79782 RepID=A0A8I6RH68_CIMLE|nr:probable protein phosphatase 2C T23F11.1 [Cimex lectularius]